MKKSQCLAIQPAWFVVYCGGVAFEKKICPPTNDNLVGQLVTVPVSGSGSFQIKCFNEINPSSREGARVIFLEAGDDQDIFLSLCDTLHDKNGWRHHD